MYVDARHLIHFFYSTTYSLYLLDVLFFKKIIIPRNNNNNKSIPGNE